MAQAAKAALRSDNLDVVADRGYFKGEELLACEQAGVAVTLPKPQTSGAKSAGRFGKPDFVYLEGRRLSLPGRREAGAPLHR